MPAMAPPLSDDPLLSVVTAASDVADEGELETVIVTGWPAIVCTETVGAAVVVVLDEVEVPEAVLEEEEEELVAVAVLWPLAVPDALLLDMAM